MKNTKQLTVTLLIVIMAIFNLNAQSNSNTTLWKVEGNNIKTSYLFGTIHLLPKKDFNLTEKVQKAFNTCDKIVLEINMADPNFKIDIMENAFLKEDEDLKFYLDDDEYTMLDTYLKEKTGVGMTHYKKYKPFMLMSILSFSSFEGEAASYEMTFVEMTKKAEKKMEGLETFKDQINLFEAEPYDEQLDTFIETIKDPEKTKNIYQNLLDLYLAEDIDGIYDYMDDYMNGDIEAMKLFLDKRNNNWIPKFAEYSKNESAFYAVGAGHLGGEQGVISLLKKAGYAITPVFE